MSWDYAPWTAGDLRITRSALGVLEEQAIAGYLAEHEVCGLLAGPVEDPLLCDRAIPIENMAKILHERDPVAYPRSARTFFAFHERKLEAEMRDGRSRRSPVKVLYHSHLDVGAFLSGMDQAMLSRGCPPTHEGGEAFAGPGPAWPLAFMVTSVRRPDPARAPVVDDHKLFIWVPKRFVATGLEVVEDGPA